LHLQQPMTRLKEVYSRCGDLARLLARFTILLCVSLPSESRSNEFKVLNLLTRSLAELSLHHRIEFKGNNRENQSHKVVQPQLLGSAEKQDLKLPSLSTDPTLINPVDLAAFSLAASTPDSLKNSSNIGGLLPLPQARTVTPQEKSSKATAPKDTSPANVSLSTEADVLTQFNPQTTRFGKDRYDEELFLVKNSGLANKDISVTESPDNNSEENLLKQAKEEFEKIMISFAEKTEEIEAFRLVDYYDLKHVFYSNEQTLNLFDDDEIDLRFFDNAQTIYNRFGPKDSSSDKQPFEKFLKRMQPFAELQAYRGQYFKAGKQKKAKHQPN